jgi:hypothetical protein
MCAQVMLRALKAIRTTPELFTVAFARSYTNIPIYLFAFSTFPAVFHGFTNLENLEFAVTFLMSLIDTDAPTALIGPLFLSLLFSTFTFINALWTYVHRLFCARKQIPVDLAIRGLCEGVEACAPLVCVPIYRLIQILLAGHAMVCCDEMMRYLQISFDLWYCFSPEGMSFRPGESFRQFLAGSGDFYVGNSILIVSSLMKCKRRTPICPVLAECPELQHESIILSSVDFQLFGCAFRGMDPKMPFFDSIKSETFQRFVPFLLEYFPTYPPSKILAPPIISLPCPDFEIPAPDQVFEQAIARRLRLSNPLFDEYSLKKSILEQRNKMTDMEDFVRFQYCLQTLRAQQASLLLLRNFCVGRYCRGFFTVLNVQANSLDKVTASFLNAHCDVRRLMHPFLVALLNFVKFRVPPEILAKRFAPLRAQYEETAWAGILELRAHRQVMQLMPEVTRRKLTGIGDKFVMLSRVFTRARQVCTYYGASHGEYKKVIRFLALNTQFDDVLYVYLVCEKVVFQRDVFTNSFKAELTSDWNTFFAAMLEIIAMDPSLLDDVSRFRPI